MTPRTVFVSVILFFSILAGIHAQSGRRRGPIVRRVDRILVNSGDPKELFHFFAGDLKLPVAWPLTENPGYTSGGVGAGNVNLEFYRYAPSNGAPAHKVEEARYSGLALEPYPLSSALRELKLAGIPYDAPEPYYATLPNGTRGLQWTTVPLPSFSKAGMSVFLYEYGSAFLKADVRREQLGNRLILNKGGPLGIRSVREIVITSTNFERDKAAWQTLLGAANPSGDWSVGSGPRIRLERGTEDRIQEIAFVVESLPAAEAYVKVHGLLESASSTHIILNPAKIQALKIRLVR